MVRTWVLYQPCDALAEGRASLEAEAGCRGHHRVSSSQEYLRQPQLRQLDSTSNTIICEVISHFQKDKELVWVLQHLLAPAGLYCGLQANTYTEAIQCDPCNQSQLQNVS